MGCGGSKSEGSNAPLPASEVTAAKLHSAIRWERVGEVKDIISQNASVVNVKDESNGNTAIHIAAQNGHLELVTMLHKAGANINAQNGGGQTALHMCVTYELNDVIAFLKKNGADESILNADGIPAKYGLGGERDPNSAANKMRLLKESDSEATFLSAIAGLKGAEVDKAQVAQIGLTKKREHKAAWTSAVQTAFGELLATLA